MTDLLDKNNLSASRNSDNNVDISAFIPRLPDQDLFLLDLKNNNYSMMTIINYARDLSILALFLNKNSIEYKEMNKQTVSEYKGYLRDGQHLIDLQEMRTQLNDKYFELLAQGRIKNNSNSENENLDSRNTENNPKMLHLRANQKMAVGRDILDGSNAPRNVDNFRGDNRLMSERDFIAIYRKVFGNIGHEDSHNWVAGSKGRDAGGIEGGLDVKSVNRMLSAFRSYLKYQIDMDHEIPLPPDAIKMVRADKKKSQVAELDELIELIESPITLEHDYKVAVRNRTMLEILFATGMRISELMNLNIDQINTDGKLFITGKGRKQRYVYLTPRALSWLDKYIKVRLVYGADDADLINLNDISQSGIDSIDGLNNSSRTRKINISGVGIDDVNEGIREDDNTIDGNNEINDLNHGKNARETLVGGNVSQLGSRGTNETLLINTQENIDLAFASYFGYFGKDKSGNFENDLKNIEKTKNVAEEKYSNILICEKLRMSGYLKKFRSPALFIPFSGGRFGHRGLRLSTNYFQEKIAEYRRRLGIAIPTSAHSLRHGFATYLAENGANPAAIQVLLGHESLNTTTRYVHASDAFARDTHDNLHPLK